MICKLMISFITQQFKARHNFRNIANICGYIIIVLFVFNYIWSSPTITILACWSNKTGWWRHPMQTFSALLAFCAGNSPVPGEFPTQRPVTRSFDVFFDLQSNKRLSKQWWFETPSCPLWRHRYGHMTIASQITYNLFKLTTVIF